MNTKHDARKLHLVGKLDLRQRVVQAVTVQGLGTVEASRIFGVSRTSVFNWCKLYNSKGEDGLVPSRLGRPKGDRQLTAKQAAKLQRLIRDKNPDQLKVPFIFWTREAVRDLIKQQFGILYSINMVGVLLKQWGLTPQ